MAKNRNLMVGLVVVSAFAVLLVAIVLVGEDKALFSPREEYHLRIPNAQGLAPGSPVKLVGVQVGAISAIHLPDAAGQRDVRVTLTIKRSHLDRIREDTEAKLRFLNPLGGERFIELTLGSPDQPALPPGSEILAPLSELDILLTQGTDIASNVAEVTNTLRVVFDRIERQEGILGQLLLTPTFAQDTLRNLGESAASLREITDQLAGGEGLAGAMLSDQELKNRLTTDLAGITGRLDRVLARLEDPETPLGSLLDRDTVTGDVMENLRQASESMRKLTERVEGSEGLLVRLLDDTAYAERVLRDLEDTTRNLASITGKIDRGEGSLGGLVNDPALYQGMRDVVTGVQDSRYLRWMVNRYAQRGAKVRAKAAGDS